MRIARRHPILVAVALTAGAALAAVARVDGWSDAGIYAAMAVLLAIFGLLAALAIVREDHSGEAR
jgi:hypothetical protein